MTAYVDGPPAAPAMPTAARPPFRPARPETRAPSRAETPAAAWTPYERYVALFPEGLKGDLIAGEAIIDMSITVVHEQIVGFLIQLLGLYVQERGLGIVLGSRTTMRVDDENGYEPDVLFVRHDRLDVLGVKDVRAAVDVAVEIVSPTSGKRDRDTKFEGYQRTGVPEYWLVDPTRRDATFFRLDAAGAYHAVPLAGGVFESETVPGFRLDPQALFADPMPPVLPLLMALLDASADGAA